MSSDIHQIRKSLMLSLGSPIMSAALESIISPSRLTAFLAESHGDLTHALELYAWNMKLSASFMPLLSSAEIALRNLIVAQVVGTYGSTWWNHSQLLALLGKKGKGIVKRAENKILERGHAVVSDRITAELTFGFWKNMLLPKYATPLWSQLTTSFPHFPAGKTQADLYTACERVCDLRNRISHHEPIFQRNVSQDYSDCLTLIDWLSPDKAAWIRPHCEVMKLMRAKPKATKP